MDIDIAALGQAVVMLKTAIDAVKGLTKRLPEGEEKTKAEVTLAQAEQQLNLAEVQVASNLGYPLCRAHWPPVIMLSPDNNVWTCPECGHTRYTWPDTKVNPIKSRWE